MKKTGRWRIIGSNSWGVYRVQFEYISFFGNARWKTVEGYDGWGSYWRNFFSEADALEYIQEEKRRASLPRYTPRIIE